MTTIQILNATVREEKYWINGPRETTVVTQTVKWHTSICMDEQFSARDIVGELTTRQNWHHYMFHEKRTDVGEKGSRLPSG